MEIIGYHGTSKDIAECILVDGFRIDRDIRKLPGDLGRGVYTFLDKEINSGEAIRNARNFVKNIRKNILVPEILKVLCSVDENQIMNFNDPDNVKIFQKFRENNQEVLNKELDFLKRNGSFNRGNMDGYVIEMLLNRFNISSLVVIKDTYTWFSTELNRYKKSNFPNGREMCIRGLKVIKDISKVER